VTQRQVTDALKAITAFPEVRSLAAHLGCL